MDAEVRPKKIMDNAVAVSAGQLHSLAIKADGSLWAWGDNSGGQVGDGTKKDRYAPYKVMDHAVAAVAGYWHSLAIKSDGSLWAWGYNSDGQLGDGTVETRAAPVKIMDSVVAAAAGHAHTLAVKSDGGLWAWGFDYSGQLGDGVSTADNRLSPVKVMDSVQAVTAEGNYTMVMKKDGSVWGWGTNSGALDDGSRDTRLTPVKILDGAAQSASQAPPRPRGQSRLCRPPRMYNGTGDEEARNTVDKTARPTNSNLQIDGKNTKIEAYNINGKNYYKIRDLGDALSFHVDYDAVHNIVMIRTDV